MSEYIFSVGFKDECLRLQNKKFVETNIHLLRSHFTTFYADVATLKVMENVADSSFTIKFASFGLLITLQVPSDYSLKSAKLIFNARNKHDINYSNEDLAILESQLETALIKSDDYMSSNNVLIEIFTQAVEFTLDRSTKASEKKAKPLDNPANVEKISYSDENCLSKKASMKTAADVVKRIQWDHIINEEFITVGYMDRFLGLRECAFTSFDWGDIVLADIGALAIPEHRIVYFKYKNHLVWDKRTRIDDVFGSTGSKIRIQDVIARYQAEPFESIIEPQEEVHKVGKVISRNKSELNSEPERPRNIEPNYFISLPIRDNAIISSLNQLVHDLLESNPAIEPHLVPITSLHVTLCTLRINNQSELDMVKNILQKIVEEESQLFKQIIRFNFEGIGDFYDKVRFVKCKSEQTNIVKKLRSVILEKLGDSAIDLAGNYFEFVPHLTIMKISSSNSRAVHQSSKAVTATNLFDQNIWEKYKEYLFGAETVNEIDLCKMTNIFINKSYPVEYTIQFA